MRLSFEQVAVALGTGVPPESGVVSSYSIDTRTLEPGALFIALRGERSDGRQYLESAFDKGAVAALVEASPGGAMDPAPRPGAVLFRAADSLEGLQRLARWTRTRWASLPGARRRAVVAVTGSAGKTTTKDAIAAVVGTAVRTGKSSGNYNNHIGLPLSLLNLPEETDVAVVELGMNHAGEIRTLARLARPEIGVVTNVGYAHVENFGSIESIALSKRELIEELPRDGCAVLNADDERTASFRKVYPGRSITFGQSPEADLRADEVEFREDETSFHVAGEGEFETSLVGRHGLSNALAALATARALDIPLGGLREAVRALAPSGMRGRRVVHNGITILDDCYNANPEAMHAMLDVLRATTATRRIAVLGEMRELGSLSEELHRSVGRHAARCGLDLLVAVRGQARHLAEEARRNGMGADAVSLFEDPAEAGEFLAGIARPGDALLFKGSRGTHVEMALQKLLE